MPQIRLKTQAEADGLDQIAKYLGCHNAAEAYRHGQRVLAMLVGLEDKGYSLTLTRDDGSKEHAALELPDPDEELPTGTVRRWTVNLLDRDAAYGAAIREWSSAESARATHRVVVLVMGALSQKLSDGWVLWASSSDGDEPYRLVML